MGFEIGVGTAIAGSLWGGVAAAVIDGAVIGAAIGGLTSAISGGDIGKGLLYGAVGGAVMGGITGVLDVGGFMAGGESATQAITSGTVVGRDTGTALALAEGTYGPATTVGGVVDATAAQAHMAGGVGELTTKGTNLFSGVTDSLSEGLSGNLGQKLAVSAVGSGIEGYLSAEEQEEARKEAERVRQWKKDEAALDRASRERIAASSSRGGSSSSALEATRLQVAEQRRQFDATADEAERRRTTIAGNLGAIRAAGNTKTPIPSADYRAEIGLTERPEREEVG